jgi:O-antigen/teichoic acid export membrane protein
MITSRFLPVARVTAHLRTPLYQSAYAWLFSTAASAILGILYWVVAARYYAPEVVGVNAAIISALIFLSGISQLNLMSVLLRFIPSAGQRTGQLIAGSYGLSLLAAAVLGLLGLLVINAWPGAFSFMEVTPAFAPWFILAVMVWCIFNLQDSALTGLRATIWVPIENVTYGVLKIIVLILFAKTWPTYGIFISWVAPLLLVIIPLNVLIFRRLVPHHMEAMRGAAAPLEPKRLLKYLGGNYLGSLFTLASMRLLPIIVAFQVGPAENAYFYLAWTMAGSLKLVAINMTSSLTVEGAADHTTLTKNSHRFLLTLVGLFVPVLLFMVAATPYLLRLSGGDYAAAGTAVLRLLTLSVLPAVVTSVYLSLARAQNQTRGIVLVQGAFCLLSLLTAYIAVTFYGITGVGYALLFSELMVALVLLLTELRPYLQPAFLRQTITPLES